MASEPKTNLREYCRSLLLKEKQDREDNNILPSECTIIDILLARQLEMACVYEELYGKLSGNELAIKMALSVIVSCATFWRPEHLKEVRERKKELCEVNQTIEKLASELAMELAHRSHLNEVARLWSDTTDDICELIERASCDNQHFQMFLKEDLMYLGSRFDTKYWPSLESIVMAISRDADGAEIITKDNLTAAALVSNRPSNADFLRALYRGFDNHFLSHGGGLPDGFRLSDAAMASVMNCALNLRPDQLIDAEYVKGLRQRDREKIKI